MELEKITPTSKYFFALEKILGKDNFGLFLEKSKIASDILNGKLPVGAYYLKLSNGEQIASFVLKPMINCCGICVSTSSLVVPVWRGK